MASLLNDDRLLAKAAIDLEIIETVRVADIRHTKNVGDYVYLFRHRTGR